MQHWQREQRGQQEQQQEQQQQQEEEEEEEEEEQEQAEKEKEKEEEEQQEEEEEEEEEIQRRSSACSQEPSYHALDGARRRLLGHAVALGDGVARRVGGGGGVQRVAHVQLEALVDARAVGAAAARIQAVVAQVEFESKI